ncbi:MAG: aspartate kinase [Alphaproteobacteria bacterium]
MSICVMKFGGTSVANISRIKNIVKLIEKKINSNNKIVLVVSAMSGVTNKLIEDYKKVKRDISDPEYDVILSTGEQHSAALISVILNQKKISSRSMLGWQIPIITDNNHAKARISKINSTLIKKFLNDYQVIVIAGFQGVNEDNRVTTLGRGGSDTTAVAIAYSLGLKSCEIYTDVEGIFTSDPRIVRGASKIQSITYEEILELASLGSKVLHPRSVELAMKYGIRIHVRSSFVRKLGTMVIKEESKIEKEVVTGVTSSENEAKITLKGIPDKPGIAAKIFGILANISVNVDMIVQNITDDGKFASLTFTVPLDDQTKVVNELKNSPIKFKKIHSNKSICKISIVGVGMKSNVGVAQKMFETLASKNINIQVISTSEIKISVLIDLPKKKIALNSLHKAYNLRK